MAVVMVYEGSKAALAAVTADNTGPARIGLFQNDWKPQANQNISAVIPATFSGYDGLHALEVWGTPFMVGEQAVSRAAQRLWAHNGGPVSNWIFGIYVVDALGVLRWAERVWNEPVLMAMAGNVLTYTPELTQQSKFPVV